MIAALLLVGAVVSPAVASSDKTIQIDEDLRVNAEVLTVVLGTSTPAHQVNIKFGEYSVVSSNAREGRQTTTSEFLSPVAHTRIRNYFTFVLKDAASTTAKVKAEWNILSEKPGQCLEIDLGIDVDIEYCLGDEEPKPGLHDLVVATVQIDGEAASRWTMLLDVVRSESGLTERAGTSFLTDGSRQIVIRPVTSAGPAKSLLDLPARGYEFWDAGRSIGAVQYYAGGALGLNKNVVYLRRDIDPQAKLLLASAMTAIMEYKLEALLDYED
jgi:nucleoid DNA-binding protein